jgi:hypothetical protein
MFDDIFGRVWENIQAHTDGPMHLRFFFQPTVSLIFAIRAGILDARKGVTPYLWRFFFTKNQRGLIAREAWKDVGRIFLIGLVLDIGYQLIVVFKLKTEPFFYPLESVIVAACLAIIPYLLLRGPVSRLIHLLFKPQDNK